MFAFLFQKQNNQQKNNVNKQQRELVQSSLQASISKWTEKHKIETNNKKKNVNPFSNIQYTIKTKPIIN